MEIGTLLNLMDMQMIACEANAKAKTLSELDMTAYDSGLNAKVQEVERSASESAFNLSRCRHIFEQDYERERFANKFNSADKEAASEARMKKLEDRIDELESLIKNKCVQSS
jgi:hypothetical protein